MIQQTLQNLRNCLGILWIDFTQSSPFRLHCKNTPGVRLLFGQCPNWPWFSSECVELLHNLLWWDCWIKWEVKRNIFLTFQMKHICSSFIKTAIWGSLELVEMRGLADIKSFVKMLKKCYKHETSQQWNMGNIATREVWIWLRL